MTYTTAGEGVNVQYEADILLDNIACATQNRALLRGDPAEDKVLTEAVLENGKQAISRAITKALAAQPSAGAEGEAVAWRSFHDTWKPTAPWAIWDREPKHLDAQHGYTVQSLGVIATPAQPDTGDVDCFECLAPLVGPFCPECNPSIKAALGYAVETPDTGDVAALREALARMKFLLSEVEEGVPAVCDSPLFASYEFASDFKRVVDFASLAALSKPNAQGREE